MKPIFITGIGTDIGKTVASAVVTEALEADYWKPIQAGLAGVTDANQVKAWISNSRSQIHPETYLLNLPASPHIAARAEGIVIDQELILQNAKAICQSIGSRRLIIEGAGGLLVPLNEESLVVDLIQKLDASVILVSRKYLGSINHSLLTASYCKQRGIPVLGWIFNADDGAYQSDIVRWSGYPSLGTIPQLDPIDAPTIHGIAVTLAATLKSSLNHIA